MLMDGFPVKPGDKVYDCAHGWGIVGQIKEGEGRNKAGKFMVHFGGRQYCFDAYGFGVYPERTLYWKNPKEFLIPMKDDLNWERFCVMQAALCKIFYGAQ